MNDKTASVPPLLSPAGAATIAATNVRLIVKDHFQRNPQVKISAIWEEFKRRFYGLIEEPSAKMTLRCYRLLRNSHDAPIITELGGHGRVRSTVAALLTLLQRQPGGEDGILQTNGYANIFYAHDKNGELCAIRTGWDGQGWVIDAIAVEDPLAWNGRHQIFCPETAPDGS